MTVWCDTCKKIMKHMDLGYLGNDRLRYKCEGCGAYRGHVNACVVCKRFDDNVKFDRLARQWKCEQHMPK
jgi:hypothetical protein